LFSLSGSFGSTHFLFLFVLHNIHLRSFAPFVGVGKVLIMRLLNALLFSLISGLGETRRDPRHAGRKITEKVELAEREFYSSVIPMKASRVENIKRANRPMIPQTEAVKSTSR
jgi:hypothetical protein